MKITFDSDHLAELLALSEAAEKRRPTFSQMLDPNYWREDMDRTRLTAAVEALESGGWPDIHGEDIDETKVPAGLMLVGDEGIYLMSNAISDGVEALRAEGRHVAYARETDPTRMSHEDMYHRKREIFGGDDGVEFVDANTVRAGLVSGGTFKVDITPEEIRYFKAPEDDGPQPG